MIRPCRSASLLAIGEASTCEYGRPVELRGSVSKLRRGATGWLTMEWSERPCTWTGEACPRAMAVFMLNSRRAARVGVRGSIVAVKRRNGRGVKGARKVDA